MKSPFSIAIISLSLLLLFSFKAKSQVSSQPITMPGMGYPWKNSELIDPAILAASLKTGTEKTTILNIGVVEDLPGAIHIGGVSNKQNLEKLREILKGLPKNKPVVIYCGCCPFAKCPNIRPAYNELKNAGFTQIKVLDLPTNLQTNWISKGFPIEKKQSEK
jgi:hypothetical protein